MIFNGSFSLIDWFETVLEFVCKTVWHFMAAMLNNLYYYPYRAFGGQNKIVYSTRFVMRAIFF